MFVMKEKYATYLKSENLAENTIKSYLYTAGYYLDHYSGTTSENLLNYKGYLLEKYKPRTVNLRIQAINKYLEFLGEGKLQLKFIKLQQKNFLENVISNADYTFLKVSLKNDEILDWYFAVWYLAATGARISELIQIKVEHVDVGYIDLYTKCGKLRRLYIPKILRDETFEWLGRENRNSGYLFLNRFDVRISTRGLSQQLKTYAKKYGIDPKVVYPHSFRHRFAKNFLEKYSDIALLADLMGHESIETTRIYLRRTASEQQELVDRIVTW
jgi:integrase